MGLELPVLMWIWINRCSSRNGCTKCALKAAATLGQEQDSRVVPAVPSSRNTCNHCLSTMSKLKGNNDAHLSCGTQLALHTTSNSLMNSSGLWKVLPFFSLNVGSLGGTLPL